MSDDTNQTHPLYAADRDQVDSLAHQGSRGRIKYHRRQVGDVSTWRHIKG